MKHHSSRPWVGWPGPRGSGPYSVPALAAGSPCSASRPRDPRHTVLTLSPSLVHVGPAALDGPESSASLGWVRGPRTARPPTGTTWELSTVPLAGPSRDQLRQPPSGGRPQLLPAQDRLGNTAEPPSNRQGRGKVSRTPGSEARARSPQNQRAASTCVDLLLKTQPEHAKPQRDRVRQLLTVSLGRTRGSAAAPPPSTLWRTSASTSNAGGAVLSPPRAAGPQRHGRERERAASTWLFQLWNLNSLRKVNFLLQRVSLLRDKDKIFSLSTKKNNLHRLKHLP